MENEKVLLNQQNSKSIRYPPTSRPLDSRSSAGTPVYRHRILGYHIAPSGPGGIGFTNAMLASLEPRKSLLLEFCFKKTLNFNKRNKPIFLISDLNATIGFP